MIHRISIDSHLSHSTEDAKYGMSGGRLGDLWFSYPCSFLYVLSSLVRLVFVGERQWAGQEMELSS